MFKRGILFSLMVSLLFLSACSLKKTNEISLEEAKTNKKVVVYFFYGEGCPHCSKQKEAMKAWSESFPDIEIKSFETWSNAQNGEILQNLAKAYGTSVQGVPMTFIGDEFWVGYSDSLGTEMQGKIKDCSKAICENPGQRLK